MHRLTVLSLLACLSIVAPAAASAQQSEESTSPSPGPSVSVPPAEGCFPPCRSGYLCHPDKLECVSACNPPCAASEVCSEGAECVPRDEAPAEQSAEIDDRRFRLVLLGRFGLGGKARSKLNDGLEFFVISEVEVTPGATLGFDLRFEKPVAKYVSVGGLLSSYWLRSKRSANFPEAFRELGSNDYAMDFAPFVKPRYPFRAGSKEAEVYVLVNFGGSLIVVDLLDEFNFNSASVVRGGFNVGVAPGFQVFVARHAALVFEVGYAYSWFKIDNALVKTTSIGQATLRFGFSFAF